MFINTSLTATNDTAYDGSKIIINNKIFIYNLHLLLLFSYIPIFRGLCPQGVMSAGGFVRRGFYSGGFVHRGFCPQGVMS